MWRKMLVFGAVGGLVASGSAAGRVHTVKRGENLSVIAQRYGVPATTIAAANRVRNPNLIEAGRALSIPGPAGPVAGPAPGRATPPAGAEPAHRVQPGETLDVVARRYGVGIAALAAANGIANPNFVASGTVLRIPSGRAMPPAATRPVPQRPMRPHVVVTMPPATLAAARSGPRIIVPPDRAVLRTAFLNFSRLAGVPSDLAMALAWQESGWQRNLVSSTRAVGVMQLMPDTVEFVSTQLLRTQPLNPWDPVANIRMGTRFLRYLLDANGGNVDRALASYYQGLRSVRERGMLPETERFVANVKALRGRL